MDAARIEVRSAEELWAWLGTHHGQPDSVWLVTWKAAHPERYVARDAVLDALIAHGWIDGRRMKLDDARTMQLIAPRRQQAWADTYKRRAARLEAEGRMRPPGRAAIAASKKAGLWDASAAVDALEAPPELLAALSAAGALPWWEAAAPSYRRNVLRWLASAKRPQTKAKRVGIITAHAARREKVPQF